MKKIFISSLIKVNLILLLLVCGVTAYAKPRITIIATGGTIAGAASSSVNDAYQPAQLSVKQIVASVPGIENLAEINTIQLTNIASQNMTEDVWLTIRQTIDYLFSKNLADGVVITHGTDTMEETAYFLYLTLNHSYPIVITGSMRPSTSLSADGPMNLYNAVATAASPDSKGKGAMILMNATIFSAADVYKGNTVAVDAFESVYGPIGYVRNGAPKYVRNVVSGFAADKFNYQPVFDIKELKTLPKVEIITSYAFASAEPIRAVIASKAAGIVIAGVGHGNYDRAIAAEIDNAVSKGIVVVRSSRISKGGVDENAEEYSEKVPVCYNHSPQAARILLMLALTQTSKPKDVQKLFAQ
ncbi:MAG: type II asparaginase [Bacteroidales bacterium]|jgi:L-asparaginase|nr:type II asparaginase [Bacteroidales bacterium]MCI1733520.1 type II asparaginase [Bacteroidales bacterium]